MEALGERPVDELTRVEFFASHEGLSLHYEAAQTKTVPRREGYYDLTTHLPWIGERTRDVDGAHVEFFRGIRNPVGVKIGPTATGSELVALVERLNPDNEPGKLVLISRWAPARWPTRCRRWWRRSGARAATCCGSPTPCTATAARPPAG